jgi:hypothetical protein
MPEIPSIWLPWIMKTPLPEGVSETDAPNAIVVLNMSRSTAEKANLI